MTFDPIYNCIYPFYRYISPQTYSIIIGVVLAGFVKISVHKQLTSLKGKETLKKRFGFNLAAMLVASGAVWNLVQRFTTGCVLDYFDFFGIFVFNIADLMITSGIVYMFVYIIRFGTGTIFGNDNDDRS